MATGLDRVAKQLVHEPDHGPRVFRVTKYLLQGLIVLRTFGAWIIVNRQNVAHAGFWIMWPDFDGAVVPKPELAVADVDHWRRVIVDMKKIIFARLLYDEKSKRLLDKGLRTCLDRQGLGGIENLALKNFVVNCGPVLAIPAPELAVLFITKVFATVEMTVQHRLRQLLASIGRLQSVASGILGDIASDLVNFSLLERRIAAPLVGGGEDIKYIGLGQASMPQLAGNPC